MARLADRPCGRWRVLDRAIRTQRHYSEVHGSAQAGAVTYYAFLAFFPLLALAFFLVGYIARLYPGVRSDLALVLDQTLPGIVGPHGQEISFHASSQSATRVGLIGVAGVLYAGLRWVPTMRNVLAAVFGLPGPAAAVGAGAATVATVVAGVVRDLVTLVAVGAILIVSVGVTGAVVGWWHTLLGLAGASPDPTWPLHVAALVVGLGANALLVFALFRLLDHPHTTRLELWRGALLGAIGFEILKQASSYLLRFTAHEPAFQT